MQFDVFDSFFNFFFTFFILIAVVFVICFVLIFTKVLKTGSSIAKGGWVVEAPSFVVRQSQPEGSQMKTVRLPDTCPSCGAARSQEGIDWVGPMEAKCNYCGGTVKARFESI